MNRVVENTYDSINRLTVETVTGSGAATTGYGYDDANNRVSMSKGGVTTNYTYNILNEMSGFTEGNRTVTFSYDQNGNRVLRTEGTAEDWYEWDYENRLVTMTKQSAGGTGTYTWGYDYRTRRVNLTTPAVPLTLVSFSGGTSVREFENGVATVDYVRGSDWGGGVGGILYTLRNGAPSFTHCNRRGDVTAKTDLTGNLTYQAEYEAFGKRTTETGATQDRQKSNTKDEDIPGYANEGFRFRDLETGMFISKDPIGYTLMQPADKWFLDGKQVSKEKYLRALYPGTYVDTDPAKSAKTTQGEQQDHVESSLDGNAVPGKLSHWHIAEPGQPNVYAYCQDNPWSKFDPEGLFESPAWMRTIIPGQVAWDNAVTSVENGNYGSAAINFTAMLGEQVIGVLSFGEGSAYFQGTRAATASSMDRIAINPNIYKNLERQLSENGSQSIYKGLKTAEKTLAQHEAKLAKILKEGGHPSQVERTIRNVKSQIETLKKFIKDKKI